MTMNNSNMQTRPADSKSKTEAHPRTKEQILRIRAAMIIQKNVRSYLQHRAAHHRHGMVDEAELQEKLELWEANVMAAKISSQLKEYWTQSQTFTIAIGMVVLINAVTLGLEADFGTEYPHEFLIVEYVFTGIFTLELTAHFLVEGPRIYFEDRMNWLDFCLVSFSVVDVFILGTINVDADLKIMSIFRMLRLVRLGRLLRLFRIFKELTLILSGFLASVKTLSWALIFLLILLYIFAIFVRQIIGFRVKCTNSDGDETECDRSHPAAESYYAFNPEIGDQDSLFGGVDKVMVTLFVCMADGCGIDIVHPIVLKTPWLVLFWITFAFLTSFGLLNLIVGIFCENAVQTANENEKDILKSREIQRRKTLKNLRQAFIEMDEDESGQISKPEFMKAIMENANVGDAMEELGLHEEQNLFETLDADRSGAITFDQFFDGAMLIMKGHETAKAKDMVGIHLICQSLARKLRTQQDLHEDIKQEREKRSTVLSLIRAKYNQNIKTCEQTTIQVAKLAEEVKLIKDAIVSKELSRDVLSSKVISSSSPVVQSL